MKTITADNGLQFAEHERVSRATGVGFFFARPYHSWERGAKREAKEETLILVSESGVQQVDWAGCKRFTNIHNGYKVQVGQLQAGEIDFVCTKGTSRIYVQASYLIASEDTREREFGALKKIKDNYPKYVISMTPLVTRTDDDGIIHLSLREFLARGF